MKQLFKNQEKQQSDYPSKYYDGSCYYNESWEKISVGNHLYHVLKNIPKAKPWRYSEETQYFNDERQYKASVPEKNEILYTVVGHSTILIQFHDINILTDPIWLTNKGLFGRFKIPRKVNPAIPLHRVPKIDFILLSHDHYDHLDLKTIHYFIKKYDSTVITGLGVSKHITRFRRKSSIKIIELAWWESHKIKDYTFYFVPAKHFSGRGLAFNKTMWGGFIIKSSTGTIWFAGDTGMCNDLSLINERFKIDLAFLPIGCYKPLYYQKKIHLSPSDAYSLHKSFNIQKSVAIHFGTFHLGIDDVKTQIAAFETIKKTDTDTDQSFILPFFGKTETFRKKTTSNKPVVSEAF